MRCRSYLPPTFILLLILLLTACGSAKPDSVVENFYRAAAKGDVEQATKLISFSDVPAAQMVQAKGKAQMIVGEMQSRVDANDGLDKIEIVNSVIDEETKTAIVDAKVVFNNGKSTSEKHHLVREDDGWKLTLR